MTINKSITTESELRYTKEKLNDRAIDALPKWFFLKFAKILFIWMIAQSIIHICYFITFKSSVYTVLIQTLASLFTNHVEAVIKLMFLVPGIIGYNFIMLRALLHFIKKVWKKEFICEKSIRTWKHIQRLIEAKQEEEKLVDYLSIEANRDKVEIHEKGWVTYNDTDRYTGDIKENFVSLRLLLMPKDQIKAASKENHIDFAYIDTIYNDIEKFTREIN